MYRSFLYGVFVKILLLFQNQGKPVSKVDILQVLFCTPAL